MIIADRDAPNPYDPVSPTPMRDEDEYDHGVVSESAVHYQSAHLAENDAFPAAKTDSSISSVLAEMTLNHKFSLHRFGCGVFFDGSGIAVKYEGEGFRAHGDLSFWHVMKNDASYEGFFKIFNFQPKLNNPHPDNSMTHTVIQAYVVSNLFNNEVYFFLFKSHSRSAIPYFCCVY